KVIPKAKKEFMKEENGVFKIYLTAPAVEGKANDALIAFLSEHFKVRKRAIEITKGLKSRYKTITILEL
ncbi:MAG TPA: DUF167 domain-containing protein, partial [Candidatus Omnitrophota bacterium]|nr:DUF167 domain-containing protein [Candidatus Omnitrophota bacterium]